MIFAAVAQPLSALLDMGACCRWDSVDTALTYDDKYKKASFTATGDTYVFVDEKNFMSDGATYYRVLKATSMVEE